MVLTDAQWAMLEPLVEQARLRGKTPLRHLRRTLEAILWRCTNGAKWRAVPAELGPWWTAAQTFIRWSRLGVWQRLLQLAQDQAVALGMAFLDGTTVRAHQKASGAAKKGEHQQSETCVKRVAALVADLLPRPARSPTAAPSASPGQAHELAPDPLARRPDVPLWVVGDKGYSSNGFRAMIWTKGRRPAIPTRGNEVAVSCPDRIYTNRNTVERLWARLKEWRAVAARYEKTATSYLGVLNLAAVLDWLKR